MMQWSALDSGIVVVGSLCAVACALPGVLLVLRRMSMMGDAISHTVLPGLAIAFLITHSRDPLPMFIGAAVVGMITALLVQFVQSAGRTEIGASMGIVFTTLFAVGLVLMRQAVDHVDIDPDCVLYGAIETTYFDQIAWFGIDLPRAAVINGIALCVNALLITLFYKEFKVSSFDPSLATTLGFNAHVMHYLLMTMTAATTVAAFETVGSILVIAMLIVPGATAYLLTDRLLWMFLFSGVLAVLSAVLGHVAAITVPPWFGISDTSTAGMMAFTSGVIFALVWLVAPRHGIISKLAHQMALRLRITREDVLGLLYRCEEWRLDRHMPDAALIETAIGIGPVLGRLAIGGLVRRGQIVRDGRAFRLTERGRSVGRSLIRSHRLWENYLHRIMNVAPDHVHPTAEQLEHITDPTMQQALARGTDRSSTDPQGRRIP